jgi:hypothetical protein
MGRSLLSRAVTAAMLSPPTLTEAQDLEPIFSSPPPPESWDLSGEPTQREAEELAKLETFSAAIDAVASSQKNSSLAKVRGELGRPWVPETGQEELDVLAAATAEMCEDDIYRDIRDSGIPELASASTAQSQMLLDVSAHDRPPPEPRTPPNKNTKSMPIPNGTNSGRSIISQSTTNISTPTLTATFSTPVTSPSTTPQKYLSPHTPRPALLQNGISKNRLPPPL